MPGSSDQPVTHGRTPALLTAMITVGFFGVLSHLMIAGVPESGRDAIMIMLGTLGTAWTACVSYYVGSTAGSAKKTEMLARASQSDGSPP